MKGLTQHTSKTQNKPVLYLCYLGVKRCYLPLLLPPFLQLISFSKILKISLTQNFCMHCIRNLSQTVKHEP